MLRQHINKLLEKPIIYKLSQLFFAPGSSYALTKALQNFPSTVKKKSLTILDIGCGPSSWLWAIDLNPIGLDILHSYSLAFQKESHNGVTGSAMELPFSSHSIDFVFSLGVLHHLDDHAVLLVLEEMIRVCRTGGRIIILDAVLPKNRWKRPLATLIRSLDRGQSMRKQDQLEKLLPNRNNWIITRYTYALTGLEMLECHYRILD